MKQMRRKVKKKVKSKKIDEYIKFCIYCLSPLEEGERFCKTCNGDTNDDPGIELTEQQYKNEPRKKCEFCDKPIVEYALVCFACKKEQSSS